MLHLPRFRPPITRPALIVSALLLLAIGVGINRLSAGGFAACDAIADGVISESQEFTPAAVMLSGLPPIPLELVVPVAMPQIPADAAVRGNAVDGLPLQWAMVGPNGEIYQYFFDRPLAADITTWTFPAEGGVQFERDLARGHSFAAYLLTELGERAVEIGIGPFTATLTWADPLPNGIRTHNLYWSDGTYNYTLIADRPPATLVNIARRVVCEGS